jgi:hypothetical protein
LDEEVQRGDAAAVVVAKTPSKEGASQNGAQGDESECCGCPSGAKFRRQSSDEMRHQANLREHAQGKGGGHGEESWVAQEGGARAAWS